MERGTPWMDDNTVDPHVTLQLLGGLNGGHSPHLEESPSQMHTIM